MTGKSPPPEKLFSDVAQFISESRALLDQNAMMELAGLDEQVRSLCEAVLQLTQSERLQYNDRLQQLLGDLKALGDSMVEKRELIAGEIRNISQHKKANVAYRIVEASDDFKNEDEGE